MACNGDCFDCDVANRSLCLTCKTGFFLSNMTCPRCPLGCDICNNAYSCVSCTQDPNQGLFFSSQFYQCVPCAPNCRSCFPWGGCSLCATNFTLDNGVCRNSSLNCNDGCPAASCSPSPTFCTASACLAGFYKFGNVCKPCSLGCSNCSQNLTGQSVCSQCQTGLYLKSGVCSRCAPDCQVCDSRNATICLTASAGNYLDNGISKPCKS